MDSANNGVVHMISLARITQLDGASYTASAQFDLIPQISPPSTAPPNFVI